jgi:hypothetical protein
MNTERKSIPRELPKKRERFGWLKIEVGKSYVEQYTTAVTDAERTDIDVVTFVREAVEFAILKSARVVKEALAKQNGNVVRSD